MQNKCYTVAGMMSGTSLDGMDLIVCRFQKENGKWQYRTIKAETFEYPVVWKEMLTNASSLDALSFLSLHNEYGTYIGNRIKNFLSSVDEKPDLVASHGHTIFHQPDRRFTFQLGSGASIAAACRITTVSDFRTMDVAMGGQGAPLVPVGDEQLFGEYQFCLNLGGFANISNLKEGVLIACDLCPVNIIANHLALKKGMEYDQDGLLGRKGKVNTDLLQKMNDLEFYKKQGPRSLGREWTESEFLPLFSEHKTETEDSLRTLYEHIACQTAEYINRYPTGKVLVTGGGAFNKFLIEVMQEKIASELIIPDNYVVKFKEALIFAFLGLLRYLNEINCYASVTGASSDSSLGTVFLVTP